LGNIVKRRRPPQGLSFWLGVILLALSFAIYPAYPVVPFLPVSALRKGEVAVGLLAVSWGDVLSGVGARRQEGRGLPQATLLRVEGAPTGSPPNVMWAKTS
jgi:hypothetical protein